MPVERQDIQQRAVPRNQDGGAGGLRRRFKHKSSDRGAGADRENVPNMSNVAGESENHAMERRKESIRAIHTSSIGQQQRGTLSTHGQRTECGETDSVATASTGFSDELQSLLYMVDEALDGTHLHHVARPDEDMQKQREVLPEAMRAQHNAGEEQTRCTTSQQRLQRDPLCTLVKLQRHTSLTPGKLVEVWNNVEQGWELAELIESVHRTSTSEIWQVQYFLEDAPAATLEPFLTVRNWQQAAG
jgi:hypothetical protein